MKLIKLFLAVIFISSCNTTFTQNKSVLTELRTFELSGVKGRIDHLSIDLNSKRLFISALGNGTVEVLDLTNGKIINSIRNLIEPQGVEYVEKNNLLFVTSAGDGTCKIYDASNFRLLKQINLEDDADNIRYDKNTNIIFVGFGSGGIAAIDAQKLKLLYKIYLPAHPEAFQIDNKNRKVFVNVPDANQLDVVDINKKLVTDKIKLGVRNNFPMALDTVHRTIIAGSWNPARLTLLDEKSLKVISSYSIPGDADDIYYDREDSLILISCGSGYVDVFNYKDPFHLTLTEKIKTSPGARTSLYVPELKEYFVAARQYSGNNAKIIVYSISIIKKRR